MSITQFSANEIVTRANVNQRISGINNEIATLTPVILYSNSSGTTGTITLSESVTNYSAVEIYAGNSNSLRGGNVTVWINNSSSFSAGILTATPKYESPSDPVVLLQISEIIISGTSITWGNRVNCSITVGSIGVGMSTLQTLIYRVVGYK